VRELSSSITSVVWNKDRQKFYANYLSGLFIREYKIKKTAAKRSDGFACFIQVGKNV
jgi:catalase (peroxidase I)